MGLIHRRVVLTAYADSEVVPYIAIPPEVCHAAKGIALGCRARISWRGKFTSAAMLDIGPRNKAGELSIAAARALGLKSSPRNGGTSLQEILCEFWSGHPPNST